jgi:hypothetical protein
MAFEYLSNGLRDSPITGEIGWHKDRFRAEALGMNRWHSRTDAEPSRFVRGRTDDRTLALPRDYDRSAAQLRIVSLLD